MDKIKQSKMNVEKWIWRYSDKQIWNKIKVDAYLINSEILFCTILKIFNWCILFFYLTEFISTIANVLILY